VTALQVEIESGCATLTLDRPAQRNAMSTTMLAELNEASADLADAAGLRGLLITGAGDSFCSGGDLEAIRDCLHDEEADVVADSRAQVSLLQQAILNVRRMPFPVVAAVNGLAAGSGFGLALACDDRIAGPGARFMAAYGSVGLTPDAGLTYLLPRIVGDARAREIILGDQALRAGRAKDLGLVNEVVPLDDLLAAGRRRLRRLGRWAPRSIAATKQLLSAAWGEGFADHLQRERHLFADACATDDFREGIEAFDSGRKPRFEGR
jgi:enoyl-CoA hydratase/carnithine racemase